MCWTGWVSDMGRDQEHFSPLQTAWVVQVALRDSIVTITDHKKHVLDEVNLRL